MRTAHILISIIISLVSINLCYGAEKWQYNVVNYEHSIYKAGFQNWHILQNENGWMYFANSKGLLEFDGVYWNLYNVPNNILHSLKFCDKRLYVGGSSEFGFFEKDKLGKINYNSLSDTLPTWGGEVWNITQIEDNIYFLADNYIFIFNTKQQKINTISLGIKVDYSSTAIGNTLYIATTNGLFFLNKKNELEILPNCATILEQKIVGMSAYKNKILVTTSNSGIYEVDNGVCTKISTVADNFISKNQIFCSTIEGTTMVLGSVSNGAFVFDLENKTDETQQFNITNGLINNTVLSVYFDNEKNLWLGLDKGISYINLNSPVKSLFSVNSAIGTGYCSKSYNGDIYFGTNQGLYKADSNGTLQMLPNSEGQIWSMKIIDGNLFACGDNGITVITPTERYRINATGVWGIQLIAENQNTIIAGTYQGFRLIDKIGTKWSRVRTIFNYPNSCRGFLEDDINNDFWVANVGGQIERITIDIDKALLVKRKIYDIDGAKVGDNNIIQRFFGNIVFCANSGIFMYDRISDTFIPYSQLENMLQGKKYYDFLNMDKFNNFWYVTDSRLKMLAWDDEKYAQYSIDWGFYNNLIENFENVNSIDSKNTILSVEKGFVKIDMSKINEIRPPTNIFIKHIFSVKNEETTDYYAENKQITIPFSNNSLSILFGATMFSNADNLRYSYRLVGQNDEWTSPGNKTSQEYSNLTEGSYIFEVKAFTNDDQTKAITTSVQFRILPPWYRTFWAYLVYLLIVSALIYYLYKQTISKQQNIIRQKEQKLQTQSKIHEAEQMLKDQTIDKLQNENLKKDLNYKTQELSGYVLNLIRKNEMLEDVKKEVLSISKAIDEGKQTPTIKQKIVKLTSQINENIDHDDDFEVFTSNFNLVHKDFFTTLDERFAGLSRNEKVLCAYLKMNLSSKEIAALQNISLRGVEINRYRLRKKLNLDREINLTEFIQSI